MKVSQISMVILFSVFSCSLSAQLSFKVGVGPQLSNLSSPLTEYDLQPGINADFRMVAGSEKKLQLEMGLGYNQKGDRYTTLTSDLRWPSQHDGMGGYDPTIPAGEGNTATYKLISKSSQVELPIQVSYYFTAPSDGFYVLGSLRPSLGIVYTNTLKEFDSGGKKINSAKTKVVESLQPEKFNVISRGGIGFEIATESSLNYFVEVYGEAQMMNISKVFKAKFYHYGFGLLAGVRF